MADQIYIFNDWEAADDAVGSICQSLDGQGLQWSVGDLEGLPTHQMCVVTKDTKLIGYFIYDARENQEFPCTTTNADISIIPSPNSAVGKLLRNFHKPEWGVSNEAQKTALARIIQERTGEFGSERSEGMSSPQP